MAPDPAAHLLDGLTEAQSRAVQTTEGPVLVLAGPGSGKTTVVARRMAWLALQGVPVRHMLALTFTNKAADEMGRRAAMMMERAGVTGGMSAAPPTATFHAFCARMLRRYAPELGRRGDFTLYDASDQREAIRRAIGLAGCDTQNFTPASVASFIGRAKQQLMDAHASAAQASDFRSRNIARIYASYEAFLRENDALDFDDLLMLVARLMREVPGVRDEIRARFHYLLVDEYQDTNYAQFVIARELAHEHRNICVVGDPDQSIYGWRGADISNILDFEQSFPGAVIIPLGQNFRSTAHIVHAADMLIRHNLQRKDRPLSTELGDGNRVLLVTVSDEHSEAEAVVRHVRKWNEETSTPWREMAVLYRTNALSRVLEDAFMRAQIPYVVARGTAFFDRKEVRDAIAWLRMVRNPADEIAFDRAVAAPPRGLGRTSLDRLGAYAAKHGVPLTSVLRDARQIPGLTPRAAGAAVKLAAILDDAARALERVGTLAEFVSDLLVRCGLEGMYRDSDAEEDFERLENLREVVNAAAEVDGAAGGSAEAGAVTTGERLVRLLERIALVSDADQVDPERGAVTLMTLHAAKGLEFDCVTVIGLEEGLLPHSMSAGSDIGIEEERRLLYVGMTRARRILMLTSGTSRTQRGFCNAAVPSRFLRELPEDAIEWHDERGAGGGSWRRETDEQGIAGLVIGCRVRHPTFGTGNVTSLQARPSGSTARVVFDRSGEKTLVLEYAHLERI